MARRKTGICLMAVLLGLLALVPVVAVAQQFPTREIRIVVPYGPGGASDQAARQIAAIVAKYGWINQPIVVTNMAGAATKDGIGHVATSRPDGHTLLLHHNAFVTGEVLEQLTGNLTWSRGFAPVAGILESPMTLTVLAKSPWQTSGELLADVRRRPGEIIFGFPGINVPSYFGTRALLGELGLDGAIHEVFFEGGAATKAAHLGGQVDVVPAWTMDSVPEARSGLFRILAVASETRLSVLPETPTFAEAGLPMPNLGAGMALRLGVWAPRNTPATVLDELERLIAKVVETEEWQEFAASLGAVARFRTADEVREIFQAETEAFGEIAARIRR